jgi:predicted metalloprotease with PDZ domain
VTAISYRLAMPEPHSHLFEVEMRIESAPGPVELVMPSWTPGSYLLREFARQLQDFRVERPDGAGGWSAAAWSKTDKATWRVEVPEAGELRVRYRVYANELTVRTSHLDATHGHVNGASVFLFARGRESEPAEVAIDAPAGWRVTTPLPEAGPLRYRARDYDELVDSPIEIGTHELLEWEQSGIAHRYAIWGEGNYDPERLVTDTRKIVAAAEQMFGGLPYESYTFFLHLIPQGGGGLEHRECSSLQADRWAFEGEEYENFLGLVAHEHFHVWNAKRIRPAPLGPFDYTRENYTRSLWVVEGLTTYYTDLVLRRAGVIGPERYLARLADSIARFQLQPGRLHQTLEDSSFDTWIRFYRADEQTPNSQISYYHKGALVGLLLDLEIRRATGNERSLDDVMRLLWERYGQPDVGYPESGEGSVEALAAEVADTDLSAFFDRWLRSTGELDYARGLEVAGLRLAAPPEPGAGDPAAAPAVRRPPDAAVLETRLGIRARDQLGRLRVSNVFSETPAWRAGVDAQDEVVALNGFRVTTATDLAKRAWGRAPGDRLFLTVFRRDELVTLSIELEGPAAPKRKIVRVAAPTPAQNAVYATWLGVGTGTDDAPAPAD